MAVFLTAKCGTRRPARVDKGKGSIARIRTRNTGVTNRHVLLLLLVL